MKYSYLFRYNSRSVFKFHLSLSHAEHTSFQLTKLTSCNNFNKLNLFEF